MTTLVPSQPLPTAFTPPSMPYQIAIIGAGPKGLYALERLLAHLSEQKSSHPVAIHLFNRSPFFGAGDIYRTDQPGYLLMNYPNGFINMWPAAGPAPIVDRPQTFVDWLSCRQQQPISPDDYAPRKQVGEYLTAGFKLLCQHCPSHITIYRTAGEVVDLALRQKQIQLRVDGKWLPQKFDQLLLATGHIMPKGTDASDQQIEFIYPVEKKLAPIKAGAQVAIKGLGLTFIDAVLAMTEGRGGRFRAMNDHQLIYEASGQEPACMYPFSRSGYPMVPRQSTYGIAAPLLRYFTKEKIAAIREQKNTATLDFSQDLLPLIRQEIVYTYYRQYLLHFGEELVFHSDFEEVQRQIDHFHTRFPQAIRFGLATLFQPLAADDADRHTRTRALLDDLLEQAQQGETQSAYAKAAGHWRHLSSLFNECYSFGGLTAASQRDFCENYAGSFNRIAYGPPLINMKKISALAAAGLLDFSYARSPRITWQREEGQYLLQLADGTRSSRIDHLVDARIPATNIQKDASPLLKNLLAAGHISPYANQNGTTNFQPGCLHLNQAGQIIDRRGNTLPHISVTGTPTEGLTFDNDTLSTSRNNFGAIWAGRVATEIASLHAKKITK